MDQPVGQERHSHRAAVGDVDGDVREILTHPEQRHRRRAVLLSPEEHGRAHGGHEHLVQRAAEHGDELTPETNDTEDHVARLVEDEIDHVQEVQDRARRHRDAVGEDQQREETQGHETGEAADDLRAHYGRSHSPRSKRSTIMALSYTPF